MRYVLRGLLAYVLYKWWDVNCYYIYCLALQIDFFLCFLHFLFWPPVFHFLLCIRSASGLQFLSLTSHSTDFSAVSDFRSIGRQVSFNASVINHGPSTIRSGSVRITWPIAHRCTGNTSFLFYLASVQVRGGSLIETHILATIDLATVHSSTYSLVPCLSGLAVYITSERTHLLWTT